MPLNFPPSPTSGQEYEGFYWDSTAQIWLKKPLPNLVLFNNQTGTSYTIALSDIDKVIQLSNTDPISLIVPADSTTNFPNGSTIGIIQTNTGQVTISGAVGVTVNATPGLVMRDQWSSASLIKRSANTWIVVGDLVEE